MKKNAFKFVFAFTVILAVGLWGCWYEQNEDSPPTGPDSTGVQGWTIYLTITPSTVPANGNATMNVQARFWKLDDQSAVPNQAIYLSIYDSQTGLPASPYEVSFADQSVTAQVITNGMGTADIKMYVGRLNITVAEKRYYVRAEATIDFDNNAGNIWNTHFFRVYNPYWDGKDTPVPEPTATTSDKNLPTADFTFYPTKTIDCDAITFDASLSFDTGANNERAYDQIVSYHWFFGDGETAEGKIVVHKYEEDSGTFEDTEAVYSVELVVYDDEGKPAQLVKDGPQVGGCY